MSKQALIDRVWRDRLLSYSAPAPPPTPVPVLRPEPGRTRVVAIPWGMMAGTALAAFAGVYAGAAARQAVARSNRVDDSIDWLSDFS
jgi:hypothetical protein